MSVVNVKVAHIRPFYDDLREWMKDPNNVYIGRAGIVFIDGKRFPSQPSPWANPFKIGQEGTRIEVLEKYRVYIRKKIKTEKLDLETLRGKRLGCWCHPENCHGDILLEMLEE